MVFINILGIETSCDETAAAIVKDGRYVISSEISSQVENHKIYGGVVPEIASRMHIENIDFVVDMCFKKCGFCLGDVDAISVTYGPGLVGSLIVGVNFAKGLALALKKPLIAVHHIRAHIAANYITNKNLKPPFLALVVSGGHTNLVYVEDYLKFNILGRTVDDAIGEAYDKVGRVLGLCYPAGATIDRLAAVGNETKYVFPKPSIKNRPLDFSFSGLKTAVLNRFKYEKDSGLCFNIEDFAASFQKSVCDLVCEKVFMCVKKLNINKLVMCGGVAANSGLRKTLLKYSKLNDVELFMPDLILCTDNAAMVASQAYFEYMAGNYENDLSLNAVACVEI